MFDRTICLCAALLIFGTLGACYSFSVSRAVVDAKNGWTTESAGRGERLTGPDLVMYVGAANLVTSFVDETKKDDFRVALYFIPKTNDLEVDLSKVSLVLSSGPELRPNRIEAMAGGWAGAYCQKCLKCDLESGPPFALRGSLCVNLYYGTQPPSPDTEFAIRIPEILGKVDGRHVPVPEIRFKKGMGLAPIISNR